MVSIGTFTLGVWFGVLIMALARAASTHDEQDDDSISLRDRHGRQVRLGRDGSRSIA